MPNICKTYVLDTSVLLSAPNAPHQFAEHEVVIPLVVIKELESKRNDALLGYQAREALRGLDAISERGDINDGVTVNARGGSVRIEVNHVNQSGLPDALASDRTHDTRILAVAKNLATEGRDVTVVSKDMPMRLLAKTLGLGAEQYRNEMVVVTDAYTGIERMEVADHTIDNLYRLQCLDYFSIIDPAFDEIPANTGVILSGPTKSALARVDHDKRLNLVRSDIEAFGVRGRSAEQRIALTHLLDRQIGVVSLGGAAGSGKTALAIAAGLEAVLERKEYAKVVVFRPMYAVGGQEMGFLPGTAEEKMSPWSAAVTDALEGIASKEAIEEVTARGLVEVQPLTYIRGRTLHDAYVIVDEAQSLEKAVLLTALTRIGSSSKIVLTHDVAQRDNLRVGRYDGIAAVVERLKGEPLFAHTTFTKSERGPVAEMATRLLDDMV